MRQLLRYGLIVITALWLSAAWGESAKENSEAPVDEGLIAAIEGTHRTETFVARDAFRHPEETLAFFGIQRDMTVVEIWPGSGGYFTEILAPYLRFSGKLYAAQFDPDTGRKYYTSAREKFLAKMAGNNDVYGAVEITTFNPPTKTDIAPEGTADMVLTFRNVHNWYMGEGKDARVEAAFAAFYKALKSGGVLGVVEHQLPAERPDEAMENSGYMKKAYVIRMAKAAGFVLAAESDINANPRDTADHPKGVWTLPPTLSLKEENRDHYLAIGESNRMTLKFLKP
ncbi:MAG: methyltransferase [Gammaproteobacteria bacterium]|nr:methyltransferase [Gammaproteobacteria bacterium]